MGLDRSTQTSPTLLGRLRQAPNDEPAWNAFVQRYGPKIYAWCRQWGLAGSDADDVAQSVLLLLARKLRTFVYDSSRTFRDWLRTACKNALSDFLDDRARPDRSSGDSQVLEILKGVAVRDDLVARLEEQFDQELMEEASARVRLRVEPHNWEAFRLTAWEGLSAEAAAEELGIRITAVFKAKSRILQMLRDEIARLEQATAGESQP
jgi:RNA polymerase sigma-70 factor (ECF subfamily)